MDGEDISAVNFTIDEASTNFTIPPFEEIDILLFNALGFSFLLGIPTDAYVIWLIITAAGIRVQSDFFILSLSVCELFYSLNSLFNFFTILFQFQSLLVLTHFLLGLAITGSPLFQCLMCVEHYLAVVHPVTFLKLKPLRYRVICCMVAWIITLASCIISLLNFLIFNLYVQMLFLLLQLIPFLTIKLFCCLAVLRALKQTGPGEKEKEREEENHVKRKAFYLILITTVNTVITYVPFTLSVLLFIVTEHYFRVLSSVSNVCFMLAGFVPPVLYLHRIGKLSCLSICNTLS